jgi:ferrous iron transport protein B
LIDEQNKLTPLSIEISPGASVATALSLLAWYVFAPQCLSTLAVMRRETNSWKWVMVATTYLFGLAYFASFITYQTAKGFGL